MAGSQSTCVRTCLFVLLLVLPARLLSAQTVVDPTTVEFDPSADHSGVRSDGRPIVDRYTFIVYAAGSTTSVATADLGKPLPDLDGKIRVRFIDLLSTPLAAGVSYESRVRADGPDGSAASTLSNTFSIGPVCSTTIAPLSQSVGAAGGTGTVTVTAGTGCAWTAVANAGWLTLTSGASGTGSGTVAFSVSANTTTTSRNGTITVGGQTFTVTQAANSCSYSVSPTTVSALSTGHSGSVSVITGSSCGWTATSEVSWITITSGASMTGLGSANYTVAANTGTKSRTGTMTVAGQAITVTQAANSCSYSVSPTTVSALSTGHSGSVSVITGSSCGWTATSAVSWITITGGASMTGLGSANYTVAANTGTTARTGTMTVAGQTVTVTQAANSCSYSVSPTSVDAPSTGLDGSISVTTGSSCGWTATSSVKWIRITSGASMTGLGSATYSVAANNTNAVRTGTMTIAGQTVTVTQPVSCSYSVSPTTVSAPSGGSTGSVAVTTGPSCAWTATSAVSWIAITSNEAMTGLGSATYTIAANASTAPRTGTITVAGQTVTVTQAGITCSYAISPTSQSFPADGGDGSTSVTANAGCTWTATSDATWITVTSGATGSGNGTAAFRVAANTTTAARSSTLTIAGRTFQVSQAAACSYTLAPTTANVAAAGGQGTITVTAGTGCSWSAVSSTSWITVTGSGTGPGSATYTVAANTTGAARTGSVLIGGAEVKITQAAATPPSAPTGLRFNQ